MIGWIFGEIKYKWENGPKKGIIINCRDIGYEIQILSRTFLSIDLSNNIELWIHQILKENENNLYGFKEMEERDLFRKLVSVNGVGPQIGISLLDALSTDQLVIAIKTENIKTLTTAQGVGKRLAEKLILDMRNKLDDFALSTCQKTTSNESEDPNVEFFQNTTIKELIQNLSELGYEDSEIKKGLISEMLNIKTKWPNLEPSTIIDLKVPFDELFKSILVRLSQDKSPNGT